MGDRNNGNGGGHFNPWSMGAAIAGAGGLFLMFKFYQDNSTKQNYSHISGSNNNFNSNINSNNTTYLSEGVNIKTR
jgi:hypothetical protein